MDFKNSITVTVAAYRGSIPTTLGSKAVITAAGLHTGTIGGGKIEARAISHALSLLADPASPPCQLVTWNLRKDIAMTCGGEMTLFFELIRAAPAWHIAIFGAGHIVQALLPVLAPLSCRIDLVDTRPEWLAKIPPQPNLTTHLVNAHTDALPLITEKTQLLSITQGHSTDFPILAEALRSFPEIAFIGVIGSLSKRATLTRELREAGLPECLIAKIHCPLGLPIGDNTPAEIAISITAQLLQVRQEHATNPYQESDGR